jgi:hypothetical protein
MTVSARFLLVLVVGAACAHAPPTPEYWAVLPDGKTTQVEAVAPEYARSRMWLASTPTVVCSGPGECREVIGMRPCGAPGSMICFDPDQTKCIQCGHEKFVLRLGAKR